jgi:hypothetical protein
MPAPHDFAALIGALSDLGKALADPKAVRTARDDADARRDYQVIYSRVMAVRTQLCKPLGTGYLAYLDPLIPAKVRDRIRELYLILTEQNLRIDVDAAIQVDNRSRRALLEYVGDTVMLLESAADQRAERGAPVKYPRALAMALDLFAQKDRPKDRTIHRKCREEYGKLETIPSSVESFMRTVRRHAGKNARG